MSRPRVSSQPQRSAGNNRNIEESLLECKETLDKVMKCYKDVAVDLLVGCARFCGFVI